MELFFSAVGLAMILEGLPYFASPDTVKEFARKLPSLPNRLLRTLGLVVIISGLILIFLGRRFFE